MARKHARRPATAPAGSTPPPALPQNPAVYGQLCALVTPSHSRKPKDTAHE